MHAPNRRLSDFLRKNWLCWDVWPALFSKATLFSLREVLCGPQICLKFVGGSAPDTAGEAHDAPPDPLVGWAPILNPLGSFGAQLLCPQCKILATPLCRYIFRKYRSGHLVKVKVTGVKSMKRDPPYPAGHEPSKHKLAYIFRILS